MQKWMAFSKRHQLGTKFTHNDQASMVKYWTGMAYLTYGGTRSEEVSERIESNEPCGRREYSSLTLTNSDSLKMRLINSLGASLLLSSTSWNNA